MFYDTGAVSSVNMLQYSCEDSVRDGMWSKFWYYGYWKSRKHYRRHAALWNYNYDYM